MESGGGAEVRRNGLSCLAAGLAGATLAALANALLFPGAFGLSYLASKYLIVASGTLVVGALLGLASPWYAKLLRGRVPARPLAFWLGLLAGLAGLAGGLIGASSRYTGPGKFAVPACALVGLALAPLAARLGAPGKRASAALGLLGVAAALAFYFGVLPDHSTDRGRGFSAQQRQPLPPSPPPAGGNAPQGPDVVLISVDTLRADALLDDRIPTPALRALRERSLWSDYALAPYPGTLPSHVSMLTGVGILTHGTRANSQCLRADIPTLAETMTSAGYRTLGVVSNGVLRPESHIDRGFQLYVNLALGLDAGSVTKQFNRNDSRGTWAGWLLPSRCEDPFFTNLVRHRGLLEASAGEAPGWMARDLGLAYLSDLARDPRPYFFFLHFMDPHQPYDPDPSVAGKLPRGEAMPERYRGYQAGSLALAQTVKNDLDQDLPDALTAARLLHDAYDEEVMFVDGCIQRVLDQIQASGRPTVVLFTGDHGEQFGEHKLMLHGSSVYETLLRVPFLLSGPGIAPGRMDHHPRVEDIPPTLLKLCGIPAPASMEGQDLLAAVPPREWFVAADSHDDFAYYEGTWKLICGQTGLGTPQVALTPRGLYDTAADAAELDDRSAAEPERLQRMLASALEKARLAKAGEEAALSSGDHHMLDQLGYGNGG